MVFDVPEGGLLVASCQWPECDGTSHELFTPVLTCTHWKNPEASATLTFGLVFCVNCKDRYAVLEKLKEMAEATMHDRGYAPPSGVEVEFKKLC